MKVLCVLNPEAAGGWAGKRWPQAAGELERFGLSYEVLEIRPEEPVDEWARRFGCEPLDRYGAVVGLGGDGTHSAAINAMMAYRERQPDGAVPPYVFVPLGTGNDLAKSLGIKIREDWSGQDLRRAIGAILHGADYHMDLGRMGGRYFADAVTVGLDSRILRERNRQRRVVARVPLVRHVINGRLLYALSLGRPMLKSEPVVGRIVVDGACWHEGPLLNVVVNNTRIYAGVFDFCRNAFADDGLLDVAAFSGHTDYLARYLLSLRGQTEIVWSWSERLLRNSIQTQGRRIRLEMCEPQAAQIDGEELPDGRVFDMEVVPKALWIKTPVEPV